MTGHFYSPAVLLISEMTWQTLTPEQQKILAEAASQARDYERELSLKADQELEAACKKEGMTVTHPDKAPFAEAVAVRIQQSFGDQGHRRRRCRKRVRN